VPPLSADTLFHFTPSLQNLLGILRSGFRASYCVEDLNPVVPDVGIPHDDALTVAIPMVCFCDMPLSAALRHMGTYGRYGIGLCKRWGMQRGVSPVLYAHSRSGLTAAIFAAAVRSHRIGQRKDEESKSFWDRTEVHFSQMLHSTKPYEGPLWRRGQWGDSVRFYDEREWRWVCGGETAEVLEKSEWEAPEVLAQRQEALADRRLTFKASDVRYLVVDTEAEAEDLLNELGSWWPEEDDLPHLARRIASAEYLLADL
jgi:hypothetical protein